MRKPDHATIVEIAKALDLPRATTTRRAAKEGWPFEEQTCRGGRKRFYPLATLPDAVRLAVVGQAPVERLLPDVPRAGGRSRCAAVRPGRCRTSSGGCARPGSS